ncbi:MAG: member of Set1p complex, histone methyl transferase [Candelina submexicana]|nr:MAG: member of Set1p complex, histone methyl transferase [Candelina submexicana]
MTVPTPANGQSTVKVSDVISSFRPTKLFRSQTPETSFTSLDFDDSGEFLLAACDDESLQLYNCKEGKHIKTLFSKKYGAHLARFTHHAQSVLYASTKVDDTIRYLSTHDNQFLRYFKGHTKAVTSLALCPGSDNFLSCGLDNNVHLWSLNSQNPQGKLHLTGAYFASYDPSATVIAIASPTTHSILLYDLRNYDKAPFATFDMRQNEAIFTPMAMGTNWTKLEFSNDGKSLLVGTDGPGHFLLDAFDGHLKAFCQRKPGPTGRSPPGSTKGGVPGQGDVCFSPDGRYIIGGAGDRDAVVWDTETPPGQDKVSKPFTDLPFKGRAAIVGYNPRHNLIVSADKEVVFWIPDDPTKV